MLRLSRLLASTSRGKTIQFGGDARELMLNGIERIATAVGVTLGPKGRNVIIRQADGEPKITKDGVTVARSIEFNDPFEDVGARLIRHVASKTNDVAGDGTTTATILAWRIFAEGYKSVSTGANPMDLKRGIDAAVSVLLESLSSQRRPVRGLPMLEDVATISANGERPLGRLIAAAVAAVGAAGHVAVVEGAGPATAWTRPGGWSVERGIAAGALVTNAAALRGRLDAPLVLVAAERLEAPADALRLLDAAKARGRPLVVVAPGIGEAAMQVLVHNHTQGVVLCGAVCVPELCEEEMCDVAACCGCRVEKIDAIAHVGDVACLLGEAVRVEQSFDSTVIAGSADPAPRVRLLEEKLQRALTEDAKEKLRERIAKLNHTFAVIRVGGRSAVEISESKDRVIDALNASRNALSDGIVAGGGAALLHASKKLDEMLHTEDEMDQDRRTGILIVRNAARLPMKCISDNAGEEGAVTVENVAEYEDCCMGYDAQKGEYVDMFEAGIIDPVKVVSSCVVDAASVAGLMITTEASVCDFVENAQLVGGVSGRE